MSDQITVARAIEFNARVNFLLQQKGSKFRKAVREGTHAGSKTASVVDQVGTVEMLEKMGRHAELPTVSVPITRRWVTPTPFAMRDFIDRTDTLRMLWDPKSSYAETFAMAAGRKMDNVINAAFLATAATGESGTGTEAFSATYQIAHGSVGVTVAKLRLGRQLFQEAEVDLENEELYCAISPQGENNLLAETQVNSRDYNETRDGKPILIDGRLNKFLGYTFIVTNRLTKVSTTRSNILWVKSGMYLGMWDEVKTPIDWMPAMQAWQVAATADFGATRIEQGRVIELQATEV